MATHSFAEIWDIGALDVHPVLYYWMLHLVNVIFGTNLIVYRVVTLLPTFLFAVLGATSFDGITAILPVCCLP